MTQPDEQPNDRATDALAAILDECRSHVRNFRIGANQEFQKVEETLADNHYAHLPIEVLRHALTFAESVLGAMLLVVRPYPECTLLLCRPLFELAYRVLWATSREGGWRSLVIHWSKEDLKWAEDAKRLAVRCGLPDMEKFADDILKTSRPTISATTCKHPPSFNQVLKDLERTLGEPLLAEDKYVHVYRAMSRDSHGSFGLVHQTPQTKLILATIAAVDAVHILLRSLVRTMVSEGTSEAEQEIARELLPLQQRIGDIQQFYT